MNIYRVFTYRRGLIGANKNRPAQRPLLNPRGDHFLDIFTASVPDAGSFVFGTFLTAPPAAHFQPPFSGRGGGLSGDSWCVAAVEPSAGPPTRHVSTGSELPAPTVLLSSAVGSSPGGWAGGSLKDTEAGLFPCIDGSEELKAAQCYQKKNASSICSI